MLEEIGELYRALLNPVFQITPLEADDMELWQIAALFEGEGGEGGDEPGFTSRGGDIVAQRIAAARAGQPDLTAEDVAAPTPMGALSIFGVPGVG